MGKGGMNPLGACIAIRKFPLDHFTWTDLVSFGSIDAAGVLMLEAIVRLGKNTLIAGGTGSHSVIISAKMAPRASRLEA